MGYHCKVNNWNPWILSNLLTVFLLMPPKATLFHTGLTKMLRELNNYCKDLPEVNGCAQLPGKNYRADGFRLTGKTTGISFAPAYGPEAGLSTALRQISLSDAGLQIADEFTFEKGQNQISEHFITLLPVEIAENQVILDKRFVLQANIPGQIAVDSVSFGDDAKLVNSWSTDHMNRIAFRFDTEKITKLTFTLKTL